MRTKIKLFLSALVTFVFLFCSVIISPVSFAVGDQNLALNKQTYMLNGTVGWGHIPGNAVDNNTSTFAQAGDIKAWDFEVDLGGVCSINEIVVKSDIYSYPSQYSLLISNDGYSWTQIAAESNGNGTDKTYTFDYVDTRYVKMDVSTAQTGGDYGYALHEFEVWGVWNDNINLALGKDTYMLNGSAGWGHVSDYAADGNLNTYAQAGDTKAWDFKLDLGAVFDISKIVVKTDVGSYPTQYALLASVDGNEWKEIASETNGDGSDKGYTFPIEKVRYVLMDVSAAQTGGNYGYALHEFEVWGTGANLASKQQTYMLNGNVGWGHETSHAVDGDNDTYAQAGDTKTWDFKVDLGMRCNINKIIIKPDSSNYPTQFVLKVSNDNSSWTEVAQETNGTGIDNVYTFTNADARYVLMDVSAAQTGGNYGYGLHEFEVWGIKEYELGFQDEFNGTSINTSNWVPYYLPHWHTRATSAPNYDFSSGNLVLKIIENQQPYIQYGSEACSSIQTGEYSGSLNSTIGLHNYGSNCIVREEQTNTLNYNALYGYYELKAKGSVGGGNHIAWWAVGYNDSPGKTAEIDIFEIRGKDIGASQTTIGHGIHPWSDTNISDEFYWDTVNIDASQYHIYGFEWTETELKFYVDKQLVRTINQSPDYPMVFFLNLYECKDQGYWTGPYDPDFPYPKTFTIDYFRAYKAID